MSSHHDPDARPNLLLLASDGLQSLVTLRELLAIGWAPVAIALASDQPAPATRSLGGIGLRSAPAPGSIAALAATAGIPVIDGQRDRVHAWIAARRPPLVLASCYPYRLPAMTLALAGVSYFNIHPSALPAYRGPAPIFWQLHAGETQAAVSVHRIEAALDSGDLLFQQPVTIADGSNHTQWVEKLTTTAVQGFASCLPEWLAGRRPLTPQRGEPSYNGWPQATDFLIKPDWYPRHVYNFLSGSAALGTASLELSPRDRSAPGEHLALGAVIDYHSDACGNAATSKPRWQRHQDCVVLEHRNSGGTTRLVVALRNSAGDSD